MTSQLDPQQDLDGLLSESPVDDPHTAVDRDDTRIAITVEGNPKPRFLTQLTVGTLIFLAAAFICPPIGLVALIVVPIALVVGFVIHRFNPDIFSHPVDTQALVITPTELRLYESCPRSFDLAADDSSLNPTRILSRTDVSGTHLRLPGDTDDEDWGLEIDTDDEDPLLFGAPLTVAAAGDDAIAELQWVYHLVTAGMTHIEIDRWSQ